MAISVKLYLDDPGEDVALFVTIRLLARGIEMYAQITVTASYDRPALCQALSEHVGSQGVQPLVALKGTTYASMAPAVAPTVIAAQLIRDAASILYFFDGPTTITIHITATTVAELKKQTRRVTQQLLPELNKGRKLIDARIFVEEEEGETLIMSGVRVSLLGQLSSAAGEKWASKLLVPGLVFGLSSKFLAGTPSAVAAMFGFAAAVLAFAVEVGLFVYHGDEWKWKEVP
ncbi:hypothetical protein Q4S45_10170 [Massilia sp. R2A-15]|uniref:hypothetical protein n=1 Tax=Massilia sp. R2A-15 TaxID=3064278 RepID=UPI002736CEE5|nr:hypothetical protein [Massilia sp. R2A-15]WLI91461.1 hypothetical protein Q4S45_10170 [Massilia sp. R2A-15]